MLQERPSAPNAAFPVSVLEWQSPSRIFTPKDETYVRKVLLMLVAIGLVLVFFQQFLLYAVFLALAFVSYVLRTVPPETLNHKISEFGLTSGNHNYLWKELRDFWFTEKAGYLILNVDTHLRFPPRIFMLIDPKDGRVGKEKLIEFLSPRLPYREMPQENFVDKLFDSLSQKFNLA